MKTFKKILLWLWQLPQNIIGCVVLMFISEPLHSRLGDIWYWYKKGFPGGVTLGEYIFLGSKKHITVRHEYGHVRQSRMLGPLYLLVIGLPSLIHAALHDKTCGDKSYYHFYTERWADKLEGIDR